jgi:hypothetical protein
MDQTTRQLPIRIVPRKGQQIGMLLFFGFFLGFSIFWMAGASGIVDLDNGTIHIPPPGGWAASAFGLFGLPFAAVGVCGIAGAVLKMLPGSPYFHLVVSSQGVLVRSLFRQRHYNWRELPPFETLTVERRTKSGKKISHYAVAMEGADAPANAPRNASHQREVLRIRADDYGADSSMKDAEAMAAWFNQLRDLAREDRLDANESVEVPEGFRATSLNVAAAPESALAGQAAPAIQHADRNPRRPTVERS